jgi:hypothetical protein
MRRWLKWLLVPLVLVLLLVGVQGYYWYQVKSGIDSLVASIRPVAKVEYADISVAFLGEITIENITIQPNYYKEKVLIQRALLTSPSRTFFLTANEQLRTGILNDPVSLALTGLSYNLNADYARHFRVSSSDSKNKSLDTLVCGKTHSIDRTALMSMGYRSLRGDLDLLLESSANQKLMKVRLGSEFAQLIKAEMNLWLALPQGGAYSRGGLAKAAIQMFGMTVTDLGYNQRWKSFCAQQEMIESDEYPESYRVALIENLKAEGVNVETERLLGALTGVRSHRSIVAVRLEPAVPLVLGVLASPDGADSLFSSSELALQVNGKMLDLSKPEWEVLRELFGGNVRRAALAVVEDEKAVAQGEVLNVALIKEVIPGVMPVRLPAVPKMYVTTSVDDLSAYVGSEVKLRTFFGRKMQGVLVSVNSNAISIRHQVEQGRATFPVSKDKVAMIEVYR